MQKCKGTKVWSRGKRGEEYVGDRFTGSNKWYTMHLTEGSIQAKSCYRHAVCSAGSACKKAGRSVCNGIYYEPGKCFVMLDFIPAMLGREPNGERTKT